MKTKSLFLSLLAVAFLAACHIGTTGCRTVKFSERSPTGSLSRLLPPLEAEIDMWSLESVFGATITSGSLSEWGTYEDVTYTNPLLRDIVIVFERDMRNIAQEFGRAKGRAVCRVIGGDVGGGGGVFAVLSGLTLFLPNLVGMPFMSAKATLQLEMSILDVHGQLVGRYTSEIHKSRVPVALYYGYGSDASLKVSLDVFKACMADIKEDIGLDFSRLNEALEAASSAVDPSFGTRLPGTAGVAGTGGEPTLRKDW